jgi:serine/threonine-protein kinase HipA
MTRQRLDLYLATGALGVCHAADVVLEEEAGALRRVGFRYRPEYLAHNDAFPLDPQHLPLQAGETAFRCDGGIPGFLDDYLPDQWGRRVLVRLAAARDGRRYNANSVIDTLTLMGPSRLGALSLVPPGEPPGYGPGQPLERLAEAERAAQRLDDPAGDGPAADDAGLAELLYLANSGTGVGGARPKALFHDEAGYYIAKFNRLRGDDFNHARVELACLGMARAAGLPVAEGRVVDGINGREALLLKRFDIEEDATRHHLVTANALLKDPDTQRDRGQLFRYDDVHELLQRHSVAIEADLEQLLALMLFNRCIHNTDDHERNISLIHRGAGFHLAPAYDLVPSLVTGAYHAAGYRWQTHPPLPSELGRSDRVFGLPGSRVTEIAERVAEAVGQWDQHAAAAGVSDADAAAVARNLRT